MFIEEGEVAEDDDAAGLEIDLDRVRPDLAEVLERRARPLDAARPDAVARRRATHSAPRARTSSDLCDPGTFVEYGALVIAAQRRRRTLEELIDKTPGRRHGHRRRRVNGDAVRRSRPRAAR